MLLLFLDALSAWAHLYKLADHQDLFLCGCEGGGYLPFHSLNGFIWTPQEEEEKRLLMCPRQVPRICCLRIDEGDSASILMDCLNGELLSGRAVGMDEPSWLQL